MAATATKRGRKPAPPTTLQHLQRALDELDAARRQATGDARAGIDHAMDRVRDLVKELRKHATSSQDGA